MPKIVDRAARRRLIVEALLRVADRDGLEAASSRAIAAELGVATSSLWHYFPNFDAVLSDAFDTVIARSDERIKRRTEGLWGLDAIRAMMEEILPLDAVTKAEARLVVSFWGRIATTDTFASMVTTIDIAWRASITERIYEALHAGEINAEIPVQPTVDLIMSVVSGQQVVSVTHGTVIDPDRQRSLIESIFRPYLIGRDAPR